MIPNKRTTLIRHLLQTTLIKDVPSIVKKEFDGDFKMYLYTLSTQELGDIILNR